MIGVQVGIIVFLLSILAIVCHDEYKKRKLARKSVKLSRFWNGSKERRKSVRIDTACDVLYEIAAQTKSTQHSSVTRNISVGGINLALSEKLFPGTILKIQLNIPGGSALFVQGKVVWVKEIAERFSDQQERRFFTTGIQFTQMARKSEAILKDFIKQRMKDAPEKGSI